jgi:hypothetical protein
MQRVMNRGGGDALLDLAAVPHRQGLDHMLRAACGGQLVHISISISIVALVVIR